MQRSGAQRLLFLLMQTAAEITTPLALEQPGDRLPERAVDDVVQNEVRRELNCLGEVRDDDGPPYGLRPTAFDVRHNLQKHRRNDQDQKADDDGEQRQGQTHRRTLIRRHRPRSPVASDVSARVASALLGRLRFAADFADEKSVAEEDDGERDERSEGEPNGMVDMSVDSLAQVIRGHDVKIAGAAVDVAMVTAGIFQDLV